jgi:sterol 14-demethylase
MSRLRVTVDLALCQGHAVCMQEAPEVFRVIERAAHYPQVQLLLENPPPELWDRVREAARYCPNRVITIETVED